MSTDDVDIRGREAANAARAAVLPAVTAAPPLAASIRRRRRFRRPVLLGAVTACAAALVIALAALLPSGTSVSTGPAEQPPETTTIPPPPPTGPPAPVPFDSAIAKGVASDGKAWSLVIGGPSHDVCLSVEVGSGVSSGSCAGAPYGAPPADPYAPHLQNDSRIIPMVFGRIESGVVSVEVVRANGLVTAPTAVIQGDGGPFYVAEVPERAKPTAVIGLRADGTSVRHAMSG